MRSSNNFDALILGDSYNLLGIDPAILQAQSGLSSYNLSVTGWDGTFAAFCLMRLYQRHAQQPPQAIIVGFHPYVFFPGGFSIMNIYDYADVCPQLFQQEFGLLHRLVAKIPSIKQYLIFRNLLLDPASAWILPPEIAKKWHDDLAYGGGFFGGLGENQYVPLPKDGERLEKFGYGISQEARYYLEKLLAFAEEQHIKVFYLIPSIPVGPVQPYDEFIESLKSRFPGMTIIKPQAALNRIEYYADIVHLNKHGVQILGDLLADSLRGEVTPRAQPESIKRRPEIPKL